ncbi:MAG: hypothetical protein KF795_10475 [Labilithrix sp.]|nr:hypothetical protein [Labilithrix sp.]
MPIDPTAPDRRDPQKTPPERQPASPVNPDPKAHPIHPAVPVQPIHEGTDPKTPVTQESDVAGDGARRP